MQLSFNKKLNSLQECLSPEETKKLITELIMEDPADLTQQEIDFLNSYEWFDYIRDRNGGISPFLYSRIMCLQKYISLLLKNNYYQSPNGIKIKLRIFVDPDEGKKYLFVTALDKENQPIIEAYNPVKLAIGIKNGKITYKTAADYFYNSKEQADHLILKPLKSLTKEELAFINNYSWTYVLQNELARFSPVYGFPIQCLQEYFKRLKQTGLVEKVVGTKIQVSYQFNKEKYLIISILNRQEKIINDSLGEIKILLDDKKAAIKYSVANNYYYDDMDKKNKLILQEMLSADEAKFINNYHWQDVFISVQGDFFPIKGNKISCLEKAAKKIVNNLEVLKGTKVDLKCFYDQKKQQRYLEVTLLNNQGLPIKHELNPIKILMSLENSKITYTVAEDYYFNERNRLYNIAKKPFNKLTAEDIEFINEYQGEDYYRRRNGDFCPLPGSKIKCLQAAASLFLRKGFIKQIKGTKVTYQNKYDFKKKKKYLLIYLYDQQEELIIDRANPVKIEYKFINNQFHYSLADDYYYDDWDKLNKLILKNIEKYTEDELRWLNSYSWVTKVNDKDGRFRIFKGIVFRGLKSYLNYLQENELISAVKGADINLDLEINKIEKNKIVYVTVLDNQENIIKHRNNNNAYKILIVNGKVKIIDKDLLEENIVEYDNNYYDQDDDLESDDYKIGQIIYYVSPAILASYTVAGKNNYKYIKSGRLMNYDGNFAVIEGETEPIAVGFLGHSNDEIIENIEQLKEYRLFYQAKVISRYQRR